VREIHFFEEHTCQADEAAADRRVRSNLEAFGQMAKAFALPYVALRRPDWDKFPGAAYSIAFDIPVGAGRTLQIGSVHHYRENFSGPYGIRYEDAEGNQRLVHQTTFGLSERLIGAIVAVHGDAKGAILPTAVAPYEVVVVPIPTAEAVPGPESTATEVVERLAKHGRRVHLDSGDERPGAKYYRWELQGVPLRLEIGRREANARTATAVDRLGRKQTVELGTLERDVDRVLEEFDQALLARALAGYREEFRVVRSLEELKGFAHVALVSWCGNEECGHAVETAIDGGLLGTPESELPVTLDAPSACVACGSATNVRWALAGRPL
jgi:prolyl-tRNA synthetase